jgi:rubrerythrin
MKEKTVQLAYVGGFNEVDLDDDVDLLMSHKQELSNYFTELLQKESREEAGEKGTEEVTIVHKLTNKLLSTALQIINDALPVFNKEDPNTERISNMKRDVFASARCYSKIMKQSDESLAEIVGFLL